MKLPYPSVIFVLVKHHLLFWYIAQLEQLTLTDLELSKHDSEE